jgi:hypothetical protein
VALSKILPHLTYGFEEIGQMISATFLGRLSLIHVLEYDPERKYGTAEKFTTQFYLDRLSNVAEGASPEVRNFFAANVNQICEYVRGALTLERIQNETQLTHHKLPLKYCLDILSHFGRASPRC